MKRILAVLGATSLALLGTSAAANASPTESPGGGGEMVTICHATGSSTNPYVQITMNVNGLHGHGNANHQLSEDIIPRNSVLKDGSNLDKVDWWNAGCVKPGGAVKPPGGGGHGNDDHEKITICHATGSEKNPYVVVTIDLHGLNGHANANHQHTEDIIPPNKGDVKPEGQNWTDHGKAIYNNDCKAADVPEVVPPVVPPGETPGGAVTPPGVTPVVPGAVTPAPGGAVAGPGAVVANNPGFNVQTAVTDPGAGVPPWFGGLAAMLLAGMVIAVRRARTE
ncbi:hypothetical protein [Pseudarthrobacter sp. YALA5]|uniref:hypothetical protein n=1 Tax=Pseudarthrobacter sp. DSP2-3-2b1 TaxID=2804661 RepID=UPI00103B5B9E